MMIMRQLTRAAATSTAAVGLGLAALAAPADASTLVDTDYALITGTDVDFGSIAINPGPFATGIFQPGGYGELQWESNGGDITPHLTGYLWTQNLAAMCAKMRIQYYAEAANGDYVHLATRGSPVTVRPPTRSSGRRSTWHPSATPPSCGWSSPRPWRMPWGSSASSAHRVSISGTDRGAQLLC